MAKVAAVATGLAMATSMLSLAPMAHAAALTSSQVSAIVSLLQSFGADATTIANVQASLTGGTPSSSGSTMTSSSCSFTKDLMDGASGAEVTCLQKALIAGGYTIPAGATGYFGGQTKTAVIAWQKAAGVSPASGYFGSISRAHWNLGGSSSTSTSGSTGSTGTVSAGTGTGLKVALSATSPNGTVLVQGQGVGDLADFMFSNPTASPINVTGLTFNRIGVSNDSTLTNIYLYQGVNRITDSAGISSGQFSFSNASGIFTVPAGGVVTISVRSDILTGTSGQQVGVQLVSATSSGTLDSSVSFPINSGYQTISAASLATVDFMSNASYALPSAVTSISPQNDYPVWQDTVSVSTNPVKISSMKFTNLGSIDSSYVTNLRLYVDGTQVGSAVPAMNADRTVTFDLSAAPLTLSTQSHTIKVLANITGGASRTVVLSIQRTSDAMFIDSQLNQPVTPTFGSKTFSAVSTNTITINSVGATSGVSVSLDPASPTLAVAVGASNVTWATFDMLASGENVKVSDLYVYMATGTPYADTFQNGKIVVNGVQVGSTKAIGASSGAHTDFSLGSSLILPAGQTTKVSIVSDAKYTTGGNVVDGTSVTAYLDYVANNAQGQSSLTSTAVPAALTGGNAITVSSSSLSAAMYSGYGAQTMIAGTNNARIGAFTLSAGSTEGVTVNTVAFSLKTGNGASLTNLTLKDDATGAILGTVISSPSDTSNSFSVNLDIPASQSKTVDIYANILSGANAGTIQATLTTSTQGTGDSTGQTASVASTALQSITVGTGLLSAGIGAGDPTSAIEVMGASAVPAGQFTFTSQYSAYTVDSLAVLIPASSASSVSSVSISYPDVNGATKTASAALHLSSGTQPFATAVFSGLKFYVPANSTANLNVSVGINPSTSAVSGAQITTTLDNTSNAYGGTGFHATNSAGAATTTFVGGQIASTATTGKGTLVARKSIPTFASAGSAGTIPLGSNQTIGQFNVSADAAGAVSWDQLVFTVTKTSLVTVGATSTLALWTNNGGSTWTQLTGGSFATSTPSSTNQTGTDPWGASSTGGTLTYVPAAEQQIAAGQTVGYQLRGTIGDTSGSGVTAYVNVSIQNPSTSATTGTASTVNGTSASVTWSDRSSINPTHSTSSSDWTNDYLVPGLIVNMPTLQTSH